MSMSEWWLNQDGRVATYPILATSGFTALAPADPMRSMIHFPSAQTAAVFFSLGDRAPQRFIICSPLGGQGITFRRSDWGMWITLPIWYSNPGNEPIMAVMTYSYDPAKYHKYMEMINAEFS